MSATGGPGAAPVVPVAPLHDAWLDERALAQLCFDLAHAAELVAVLERGARGAAPKHHPATAAGLEAVRAGLVAGSVTAVQVRYRFDGEEWWDTLARGPAGFRLIRISQTRAEVTREGLVG